MPFKLTSALLVLALAACTGTSPPPRQYSPCASNPGGQECQIERYQNAR